MTRKELCDKKEKSKNWGRERNNLEIAVGVGLITHLGEKKKKQCGMMAQFEREKINADPTNFGKTGDRQEGSGEWPLKKGLVGEVQRGRTSASNWREETKGSFTHGKDQVGLVGGRKKSNQGRKRGEKK